VVSSNCATASFLKRRSGGVFGADFLKKLLKKSGYKGIHLNKMALFGKVNNDLGELFEIQKGR
jgi:hypothetical protein